MRGCTPRVSKTLQVLYTPSAVVSRHQSCYRCISMRTAIGSLVLCLLFGLMLACSKKEAVSKMPDPVTMLQNHIRKSESVSKDLDWSNVKYDVSKSDSLVSPFNGVVTATFKMLGGDDHHLVSQYEYEVNLAYSEGEWRINELKALPGVMTDDTLMTYGWHTFSPKSDSYKAYEAFQKSFGFLH